MNGSMIKTGEKNLPPSLQDEVFPISHEYPMMKNHHFLVVKPSFFHINIVSKMTCMEKWYVLLSINT